MMSILVTGGTSALGRRVVRELAGLGEELVLLVPPGADLGGLPERAVRVVPGDVANLDDVGGAMVGASAVVHLAALETPSRAAPERYRAVNVTGLKNVIQVASFGAIERILYTSTVLVLGDGGGGEPGDENRQPANPVPRSPWLQSRTEALRLALDQMSQGVPLIALYPGLLYGPGREREGGFTTRMLAALAAGELRAIGGPGDRRWCHAFVDDVARGHRLAFERGEPGASYVLGGPNATLDEWLATASRVTGQPLPRIRVPYQLARLWAVAEATRARLFGATPRQILAPIELMRRSWAFSSGRAIDQLAYRESPLEEGMRRTLDAWRAAPTTR